LTPGAVPAKQANTLPHHFSLHQLKPHPPVASSAVEVPPVWSSFEPSSFAPGTGREGTWTSWANDQSVKDGSRERCIRKCESVDIDALYISYGISNMEGGLQLTTRNPNPGSAGPNSTSLTLPFIPLKTPFSIHLPSLFATADADAVADWSAADGEAEEVKEEEGSSHIRTVRSCEHDARREPCSGWAKERRRIGASCACSFSDQD
jgi:hypothetical protein